jgi:hypothetical protein
MNIKLAAFFLFFIFVTPAIIENEVIEELAKNSIVDINVVFHKQINWKIMDETLKNLDHITKGRKIVQELMSISGESQKRLMDVIKSNNLEYTNLWIQNTLSIKKVSKQIIEIISSLEEINRIWADKAVDANWEKPEKEVSTKSLQPEWSLVHINATKAWEKGITGKGIIKI